MTPPIDILWIAICSALIFVMQAGFLCLDSGMTRDAITQSGGMD